jgi:hypothetical protein
LHNEELHVLQVMIIVPVTTVFRLRRKEKKGTSNTQKFYKHDYGVSVCINGREFLDKLWKYHLPRSNSLSWC